MRLIHERLAAIGACDEALEWAFDLPEPTSPQEAWAQCPNPLWLLWLLTELLDAGVISAKPVYRASMALMEEGARELCRGNEHAVYRRAYERLQAWVVNGGATDPLARLRQDAMIEKQMCEYRDARRHYAEKMRRSWLYAALTRLLYSASTGVRPSDAADLYRAASDAAACITFAATTEEDGRAHRKRAADIVRLAVPWDEWEQALMAWAPTRKLIVE